jgi:mutator protein MutT
VAAAVGAIIKENDQILLTKRKNNPKKGFLDFPGGFVEPEETGEEAIAREVKEELNITNITKIEYITTFPNTYNYSSLDVPILDLYFSLQGDMTNLQPADDVEEIVFKKIEEISNEQLAFDSNYKILEFIKNNNI